MIVKIKMDEVVLAGTGRRFWAVCIDALLLGILFGLIVATTGNNPAGSGAQSVQVLLSAGYIWYCLARRNGQTLGKRALNVRVVKLDGTQLSDSDALVRVLVSWVSGAALLLGYLWAFVDGKNQTWHDKAAGTLVIDVRDQ